MKPSSLFIISIAFLYGCTQLEQKAIEEPLEAILKGRKVSIKSVFHPEIEQILYFQDFNTDYASFKAEYEDWSDGYKQKHTENALIFDYELDFDDNLRIRASVMSIEDVSYKRQKNLLTGKDNYYYKVTNDSITRTSPRDTEIYIIDSWTIETDEQFKNRKKTELEVASFLNEVIGFYKDKLPIMVDNSTSWDSVKVGKSRIRYYYSDISNKFFNEIRISIAKKMRIKKLIDFAQSMPEQQYNYFIEHGISFYYTVFNSNGDYLYSIEIDPESYKKSP